MSLFGQELALLRKRANITQYQLAKELDISRSHIFRIETGEKKPNKSLIEKISEILKLDNYDSLKLYVLSDLEFEIDNNKNNFKTCLHLALELKNKNVYDKARVLIEKAMLKFENMVELHALLANLNLINNDYEGAIKANEETLKYIQELSPQQVSEIGITQAEIIHNLGYVYFEKALNKIFYNNNLIIENLTIKNIISENMETIKDEIISDLKIAIEKIEQALKIEPDNLHIIDQLARVYYYLADINDKIDKKKELFDKTISLYELIISSENSFDESKKQEASIFLAMALAKTFNLRESSRLVNTIINYNPLGHLAYYAKSCIYSINGKNNKDLLDISYNSLVKAIELNNSLKEDINSEIDLCNLRFDISYKEKFNQLHFIQEGQESENK